jgi:hypothetical protein
MTKNNENVSSVNIGFQGHFILNVIPKVNLVFDEPDSATVRKFTSPDSFIIPVPIRGACKNLFSNVSCSMWWLIKRDDPEPEMVGPLTGIIILDSTDKFHVEIQGKSPEIDIVKLRLFGNGVVQYRIIPDIPRSLLFNLTSNALAFSLPINVNFTKNAALSIGSKISIAPEFPKLFDKGAVRILVKEIDEEDGEYTTTTATGCFSYTWMEGNRKPCTWMVGFSRGDGGLLTYPELRELETFEFGYDLQVSADGKEFVTVISNHNAFTGINRPRVEAFKLVFENSKVYATGKITGFAPNTAVPLQLFLKKGIGPENTIKYGNQVAFKEVDPDDKGEFRTLLFDLKPMAKAKVLPDSKTLFAMMKIAPQVWTRPFDTPIYQAMDYDEKMCAGLDKDENYVMKHKAMWICSEETEAIAKEVTRIPPLVFGTLVSKEFKERVCEICSELEIEPDYLMAAMAFESGESFSASKKNAAGSGAVGLIQFMPDTAASLGTTSEKLSKMTNVEQLDYVLKYFQPLKGKLKTLEDVYMAILYPTAVGKSNDHVLFESGTKKYSQNSGLDANKDGKITKGEAAACVKQKLISGESSRG